MRSSGCCASTNFRREFQRNISLLRFRPIVSAEMKMSATKINDMRMRSLVLRSLVLAVLQVVLGSASTFVAEGWNQVNTLGGRLAYPPIPAAAPQVLGPDTACAAGTCGHSAASIKMPARELVSVKTGASFLPSKCANDVVGCTRMPQHVAVPSGLTSVVASGLSLTAKTGAGTPVDGSQYTSTVIVGDVNGDGHLDLFMGNWMGANQLWLNDGDGTGSFTRKSGAGTPVAGSGVVATEAAAFGDVNGDGHLDIFVGNDGAANELWVGDGSGSFTAASGGPTGGTAGTRAAAFADINGDSGACHAHPSSNALARARSAK